MFAELRAAAGGANEIADDRLRLIVWQLIEWEYEPPAGTEDVVWSEPLSDASRLLESRAGLEDRACLIDNLYANRLDVEGRRADALAAFERACERHGDDQFYRTSLLADWGTLLRDEHRFREALERLREAEALLQGWRARVAELGADEAAYLEFFEATVQNELGAAAHEAGMSDVAADHLARGDVLARAIADDWGGAALWGANLVYRLNVAIEVGDFRAAGAMGAEFESDPWRAYLPEMTDALIRARLAMVATARAWNGELPAGAGEEELLALLPELAGWPGETARASAWIARSMLDRGAVDAALGVARAGRESLVEAGVHEPLRLQLLAMEARALADASDEVAARALLDAELVPAMERFLERWSRAPIEAGGTGTLAWGRSREATSELLRLVTRLVPGAEGRERALEWVVRLQAVGTFAREHGIPAPDLAAIRRELLGSGQALLCWFPGRVRSHLFVVDTAEVQYFELGPLRDLEAAVRDVQPALHAVLHHPDGAPERARLDRALQAAHGAFVPAEVARRMRALAAVHVVGLDAFGYLPFELLPAGPDSTGPDSNGPDSTGPVGLRLAVAWQPSIPVAAWLAQRARSRPVRRGGRGGPVGVRVHAGTGAVDSDRWGELAPLTASAEDVARLGAAYHSARVRFDATRPPAVLDLRGLDASVLQIVAHGLYDPARIRPAGLLLDPASEAGALFARDLEALGTALPPVVVLTACGAGRARPRRGDDGRGHLRGALFAAGADCAVLSVVDLELGASLAFSERFHESLASGATVGRALLDARRRARADSDRAAELHALLAHAWGCDARAPFPRSAKTGHALLVVALVAVLAGALIVVVRRLRGRG